MIRQTPSFWYDPDPSWQSRLLYIPSLFYRLGRMVHVAITKPKKAPVPVICVGNLTAGGSGKTPIVQALAERYKDQNPAILTRGYGGTEDGPIRVDPERHSFHAVGDEALLLSRFAPVIVSKDRYQGAVYAAQQGAKLIIMDDGFQNRSLEADFYLLVIDGKAGFGNQKLIPAGPLREPLKDGIKRANAAIIINNISHEWNLPCPVFEAQTNTVIADKSKPYAAFCGLGLPEKFFNGLEQAGVKLAAAYGFPDHYAYQDSDIEMLKSTGHKLITTAKDYVRIPQTMREGIDIADLSITLPELDILDRFVKP